MNPNPCTCPAADCKVHGKADQLVDAAQEAAKQNITLTPEQQNEVTDAMAKLGRMVEIRKRIQAISYKNPYSNKRTRDDVIAGLKEEHNKLRDEYVAAYEKYPFLPH